MLIGFDHADPTGRYTFYGDDGRKIMDIDPVNMCVTGSLTESVEELRQGAQAYFSRRFVQSGDRYYLAVADIVDGLLIMHRSAIENAADTYRNRKEHR